MLARRAPWPTGSCDAALARSNGAIFAGSSRPTAARFAGLGGCAASDAGGAGRFMGDLRAVGGAKAAEGRCTAGERGAAGTLVVVLAALVVAAGTLGAGAGEARVGGRAGVRERLKVKGLGIVAEGGGFPGERGVGATGVLGGGANTGGRDVDALNTEDTSDGAAGVVVAGCSGAGG